MAQLKLKIDPNADVLQEILDQFELAKAGSVMAKAKGAETGNALLDTVLDMITPTSPMESIPIGGIAVGPLSGVRKLAPGILLRLRELAEKVAKQANLPQGTKAFLGGGFARGFGRNKMVRGGTAGRNKAVEEVPANLADLDLIFGVPKTGIPGLRERFKDLVPNYAKSDVMDLNLQELINALSTDIREARISFGGEKRRIHGLDVGSNPVDAFAALLSEVGKGFTGFDPVIDLPLRKMKR
mgnify:CR=1 FL=1